MFENDVKRFENDLKGHFGVPEARIIKAAGGEPASCTEIDAAIQQLCDLKKPCDKIYVRITTHGLNPRNAEAFIQVKKDDQCRAGKLRAKELCEKLRKLAMKGAPICLMLNACYSGAMLDEYNWGFPTDSTIITATDDSQCGWGGAYEDNNPNGDGKITEGLLPHAFSKCLKAADADKNNDGFVDECEAFDWVKMQDPCYKDQADTSMHYPANDHPPNNPSRNPQKRVVGQAADVLMISVCNGTGAEKTDYHLILKGKVDRGKARAWRRKDDGSNGERWAFSGVMISYDEEKDETMVCWEDADDPILPGEYVNFYYRLKRKSLVVIRQYWTPTDDPPAPQDRTPPGEGRITPSGDSRQHSFDVRYIVRSEEFGGWGVPVEAMLFARVSEHEIPDEFFNLGDPHVADLPAVFLGELILEPDVPFELTVEWPEPLPPRGTIIIEAHHRWALNKAASVQLSQHVLRPRLRTPVEAP
jgi:hypothetical protein